MVGGGGPQTRKRLLFLGVCRGLGRCCPAWRVAARRPCCDLVQTADLPDAELPAPDCTLRIALVLRPAVPRRQLEYFQHLGVGVQDLVRQCGDLRDRGRIGNDLVHLPDLPLADQRLHFLERHGA